MGERVRATRLLGLALSGILLAATVAAARHFSPGQLNLLRQTRLVRLQVRASTWRAGKRPYDIGGAVRSKLRRVLPFAVPGNATPDATLLVDYREEKGASFTGGNGTDIVCTLRFVHRKLGPVFTEKMGATTQGYSIGVAIKEGKPVEPQLYEYAVQALENHPLFKHLDGIVAADLGRGDKVAILISSLENAKTGSVAVQAGKLLGTLADRRAIPPLLSVLWHQAWGETEIAEIQHSLKRLGWRPLTPEDTVRFHLANYDIWPVDTEPIRKLGGRSVPGLLLALKDTAANYGVRSNAAAALGDVRAKQAVPTLIQALEDGNWAVRQKAATALGKIGDARAIPALARMASRSPSEEERKAATDAQDLIRRTSGRHHAN